MSEENREARDEEYGSDIKIKTPFMTKLENFWYHYKWHSIAALFAVICILICSLQMCTKQGIDFHLMYAGNKEISRVSVGGDTPDYNQLKSAFSQYIDDFDGDGSKNLTMTTYFSLSPEEINAVESDPSKEVNYTLLNEDKEAMQTRLGIGEYYLWLVSPYVYETYGKAGDTVLFVPIKSYAPEENSLEFVGEYAVKLSSTALYKNNATVRRILPEDTLIVLRINSAMASAFGGAENAENYARAEEVLRRILAE